MKESRNMRKHINLLLVLAAIAALVVSAVELKRWLASTKANKDALAANAALKAQIDGLTPAAPQTDAGAAQAASKDPARKQQPARPEETWGASDAQARRKALEERKRNDREFGLKYYASVRADIDTQYGPFFRLQQLTKEQADALSEALFQKKLRYDQTYADENAGGSRADAKSARAGADAEFAAAAQEALGADSYEQLALYERQLSAWDYASRCASTLSFVDMPLSLEQAARLVDAMANASASFKKGKQVVLMGMDAAAWNAVHDAAREFLTPGQLDVLKNTGTVERTQRIMELQVAVGKAIGEEKKKR